MKSKVVETEDRVYIDNIPRLKWGENTDNSFIRSVQLTLNALGEDYSYNFLMGISGAAFRLHFDPEWCPSSADSTTGFDVSRVLFKAIGYESELFFIDDNSLTDIKFLYTKIITQINHGIPIVAINLKVCPEWGIITGYLRNEPGILCRTYFDESDEYSLAERAPWLTFYIDKTGKTLEHDLLFKDSLKLAIQLAKTDKFEKYKNGFSAFDTWIEKLKKAAHNIRAGKFQEGKNNLTIFNYLADSRQAALKYLSSMQDKMTRSDLIIANYENEIELLKETQLNILPPFNAGTDSWTEDIIKKQTDILTRVLEIEKKTISLFEKELKE